MVAPVSGTTTAVAHIQGVPSGMTVTPATTTTTATTAPLPPHDWVTVAVIILVVVAFALSEGLLVFRATATTWWQELNKPSYSPPLWSLAVLQVLAYILLLYAVYRGLRRAHDGGARLLLLVSFVALLLVQLFWLIVLFQRQDITSAYYLSFPLLFVALLLVYALSGLDGLAMGLALLYVVWTLVLVALVYSLQQLNT